MRWDQTARGQAGMIRREQLARLGYGQSEVDALVRRRAILPTAFSGVYRAAGAPLTEDAQTWLVVLGTRSVLSYLSAAKVWQLPVRGDGRVHITRGDRKAFRGKANLRIHRAELPPSALTVHRGLPVTDRTETLLDCLGWLGPGEARTVLDRALQQGWLSSASLQRRLRDHPGRWGNRQLRALWDATLPGAEAESERRVHRILRDGGITGWDANVPVTFDGQNFRLDIAFVELKVAVEVEGWAFHRSKERRDRDLAKMNALARHGWTLITFSWEHTEDPAYICASVRTVVQQRSLR